MKTVWANCFQCEIWCSKRTRVWIQTARVFCWMSTSWQKSLLSLNVSVNYSRMNLTSTTNSRCWGTSSMSKNGCLRRRFVSIEMRLKWLFATIWMAGCCSCTSAEKWTNTIWTVFINVLTYYHRQMLKFIKLKSKMGIYCAYPQCIHVQKQYFPHIVRLEWLPCPPLQILMGLIII